MRLGFHIHTKYSFDSLMDPREILKTCKKIKVDTVCITDHNSILGSIKAKKYEKEIGVSVILGEEVRTQYGEVIGVYINEEISSRDFDEVIDEIRSQGGISVLPHPFRGHKNVEYLASRVDVVEVWNGHSTPEENAKALELALKLKKPAIVGSDAHFYSEIKNAITECGSILDQEKKFYTAYPSPYVKELSNIVGHVRRGRIWNVVKPVYRMAKETIKFMFR
ncbi:putative metal-dependent phosphoesterases {PHP family} [Geoglobus ahangari]|uniref:Putative metal-dependent phosphoesterases (PHP family) n=1 Tax=Geoglobus ahangari TaxID=113653 RepID=A0A0F7IH12_9EURY|nr:PHP domain-containing protein [Geoglobus ahangari]AKG91250.1 putative metal-dependent phosphoesterases {PHP family} [Geoglobus ahangari]